MRLTREEIWLLAFILSALVLGVAVKHFRDRHRAQQVVPAAVESRE